MTFWDFIYKVYSENLIPFYIFMTLIILMIVFPLIKRIAVTVNEQLLEKKKAKYVSELEKQKSYESAILESQKISLSSYSDVHLLRINRVFPVLEDVNEIMYRYIVMSNTYFRNISLQTDFSKFPERETERCELDKKFLSYISRISMYLPEEITRVLFRFRIFMSHSWKSQEQFRMFIDGYNAGRVSNECIEILENYINCFQRMVYYYSKPFNEKFDYTDILNKYHINVDGVYITEDEIANISYDFLMVDAI